ncbi:hypothetical protein EG835_12650 [bacterium]|nr:hypothetical protein [bacterium]
MRLGIADEIVPEPSGGLHNDPAPVMAEVGARIAEALDEFSGIDPGELTQRRYERIRAVGVYGEASA